MPSLSASLNQTQKTGKIDSILFIYFLKLKSFLAYNTHSELSKNFLIHSIMCCCTEVKIFGFEAAVI